MRAYVSTKVAEMMAHEVGCPTCGKWLRWLPLAALATLAPPPPAGADPTVIDGLRPHL